MMSDSKKMPVDGGGIAKGAPDGVSGAPDGGNVHGRRAGGESGGGGYPNPHDDPSPSGTDFGSHGGDTELGYHGGGQAGAKDGGDAPNAAAGADSSDGEERGTAETPGPDRRVHAVEAGGQSFTVLETSGNAEAEGSGKIGVDDD
jgi:hypothetical protein